MKDNNKINFLEGIKGIAAIIVIIYHLLSAVYPALVNGSNVIGNHGIWYVIIGSSPLNIFYDGNLSVAFFFIISGYVLSYKYFKNNSYSIKETFIKRYFRLMPSIAISIFISYIFMKFRLFFNIEVSKITGSVWLGQFYQFNCNFIEMIKEALFGTLIFNKCNYNRTFWSMYYEFWGAFLILGLIFLIDKKSFKQRLLIYICMIFMLYNSNFLAYILGITICDIIGRKANHRLSRWY